MSRLPLADRLTEAALYATTDALRHALEVASTEAALLTAERDRLHALVNNPQTERFLEATRAEVAHQVERWGTVHDRAKEPEDWFWLVGYLAGKALAASRLGDRQKALHHTISTAAVLANWWAHITLAIEGNLGEMQPGSSDLQAFLEKTFAPILPRETSALDSASVPATTAVSITGLLRGLDCIVDSEGSGSASIATADGADVYLSGLNRATLDSLARLYAKRVVLAVDLATDEVQP